MANPVVQTSAVGVSVAVDQVGVTNFQQVKLVHGSTGRTVPIDATSGVAHSSSMGLVVALKEGAVVTVNTAPTVAGASVIAQVSGAVSISGTAAVTGTLQNVASLSTILGTADVRVSGTVAISIPVSQTVGTIVTLLGTVAVSHVANAAAPIFVSQINPPAGGGGSVTVSIPTATATGQMMWIVGGQTATGAPVFVSQINPPAGGGGSVTVSIPTATATGQMMWIIGGQTATGAPVFVSQINPPAGGGGSVTVSQPTATASAQLMWIVGGQTATGIPVGVTISNIVPVTTAVSVSVSGVPVWLNPTQQVAVSGLVGHSITGSVNIVSTAIVSLATGGTIAQLLGTAVVTLATGGTVATLLGTVLVSQRDIVPITTQASVSVSGLPVWWNPTAAVVVNTATSVVSGTVAISIPVSQALGTIITILGTQVVSVVPGVSVSLPGLSGVVATSGPVATSAFGIPVWIAGGQSLASTNPIWITGTVAAGAGTTVVSLTGTAQVSGTVSLSGPALVVTQAQSSGMLVWFGPTQTVSMSVSVSVSVSVSGGVSAVTTQVATIGAGVWLSPTQTIAPIQISVSQALGTIITQLGTQVVTLATGGTVAVLAGGGLPGSTTGSSGMSGVLVWLGASQTVVISIPVSQTIGTIVTLLGIGQVTQVGTATVMATVPTQLAWMAQVSSTAAISAGTTLLMTVWTGSTLSGAGTTQYAVPAGKELVINAIYGVLGSSASTAVNSCAFFVQCGASGSLVSANQATAGQVAMLMMSKTAVMTAASLIGLNAVVGPGMTVGAWFTAGTSVTISQFIVQGYLRG